MQRLTAFTSFLALFLTLFAMQAEALSLGPLVVSPSNDGKFYSQVNINHKPNENVQLSLASTGDYKRLQVRAPSFLKELRVQPYPALNRSDKSFYIIFSDTHVDAREFSLIVKARSDNGVILKNFDVIQTGRLQLSLKSVEKKEGLVDLLGGHSSQQTRKAPQPKPKPKAQVPQKPKKAAQPQPQKAQAPVKEKQPARTVAKQQNRVHDIIAESTRKSLRKENIAWVSDFSGFYGATKGGETVADIVERLNIPPALQPQAQLILLKDNPNLFKRENNFILKKGKYLTYADLVNRALKISPMDAYKDLNKLLGKGSISVEKPKKAKVIVSTGLDKETANAWDVFLEWKDSWEAGDINRHMKVFGKNFNNGKKKSLWAFTRYKKTLFRKFPKPQVRIKSLFLKKFQGKFYIYFQQHFSSKNYTSLGGKVLKLNKENGKWVINYERFFGSLIKEETSPYTVHVASFRMPENAYKKVAELEEFGYNAFVGYFNLGKIGNWYRVFAERLTNKSEGIGIARKLKREGLSRREAVFFLPYAIEIPPKFTEQEIIEASNGLRPYYIYKLGEISTHGRAFPKKHLLLGCYSTAERAKKTLRMLKARGIDAKIIVP